MSRAVCSVLAQEIDQNDFEVIVVNDSGRPLPDAAWQQSPRVRVIHTERRNRSVARNAGAAIAQGHYLHFLDDDDWMLPGAFQSLRELVRSSPVAWVYGAFRFVDNVGQTVAEIFPGEQGNCHMQMLFWEWLPLQASLIESKAFFAVGGFASLDSLLGGFEDVDLSRQISHYYDMAFMSKIVTCIRVGDMGSTTNYITMFQQNRQSREKALQMPGALSRMRASARESQRDAPYWHGRIAYAYLASVKWNLRQKRLFTAVSRAAHMLAALAFSAHNLFIPEFWRGVLKPHIPRQGVALSEYEVELYADTKQKLTW